MSDEIVEDWETGLSWPLRSYHNDTGFVLLKVNHDFVEERERRKKVSEGFGPTNASPWECSPMPAWEQYCLHF